MKSKIFNTLAISGWAILGLFIVMGFIMGAL